MDCGHLRECLGFKGQLLRKGQSPGVKRGGQVRPEGGISAQRRRGRYRCLVDFFPLFPHRGFQPADWENPDPGSIPANSLGPLLWDAGLEKGFLRN